METRDLENIYFRGTDLWPGFEGKTVIILGQGFYGKAFKEFFIHLQNQGIKVKVNIFRSERLFEKRNWPVNDWDKADFIINCLGQSDLNNVRCLYHHGIDPIDIFFNSGLNSNKLLISSGAARYYTTPYGKAKKIAEIGATFIPNVKIVRAYNTIGPSMDLLKGFAINTFIWQKLHGKTLKVSSKEIIRSFCYLPDIIIQMLHVLVNGIQHEIYDVGSDSKMSILEAAKLISDDIEITDQNFETRCEQDIYIPDLSRVRREFNLDLDWDSKSAILNTLKSFDAK